MKNWRKNFSLSKTSNGWKLTGQISLGSILKNGQKIVTDIGDWARRTLELQGFLKDDDTDLNEIKLEDAIELCEVLNLWPFAWNPRMPIGFTTKSDPRMLEEEKDVVLWMLSNFDQLKYAPWIPMLAKAYDLNDEYFNKCLIGELETYDPAFLNYEEPQYVPHFDVHGWGEREFGARNFTEPRIWHEEQWGTPWGAWDYSSEGEPEPFERGPDSFDIEGIDFDALPEIDSFLFKCNQPETRNIEIHMPKIGCHHYNHPLNQKRWQCTAEQCRFAVVDPPLPSNTETPPPMCDCRYLPKDLRHNYKKHDCDCALKTRTPNLEEAEAKLLQALDIIQEELCTLGKRKPIQDQLDAHFNMGYEVGKAQKRIAVKFE